MFVSTLNQVFQSRITSGMVKVFTTATTIDAVEKEAPPPPRLHRMDDVSLLKPWPHWYFSEDREGGSTKIRACLPPG